MALVRFRFAAIAGRNEPKQVDPTLEANGPPALCFVQQKNGEPPPRLWRGERSHVRGLYQLDAGEPGK